VRFAHAIERNPAIRFGCYLRPSLEICQAQTMIHDLLQRQFGLYAAGAFMPHATIKGFFRSDASLAEIVAACNRAVEGHAAIPVVNNGVVAHGRTGIGLDVHHDGFGGVNVALQRFHESVWDEIEPLIESGCRFSAGEGKRDRFFAHLTLAMADIPEFAFDEIFAFVREAEPLGTPRFLAKHVHLFAFHSDEWDGEWWHTLTWKLLHVWELPNGAPVMVPQRVSRGWQAISYTEE
jgi:hypothetical protein